MKRLRGYVDPDTIVPAVIVIMCLVIGVVVFSSLLLEKEEVQAEVQELIHGPELSERVHHVNNRLCMDEEGGTKCMLSVITDDPESVKTTKHIKLLISGEERAE